MSQYTQVKTDRIHASGAAANQVLQFNGTNWVPATLAGADGNGIYTGSGTIGSAIAASTTYATMPTGASLFSIRHSNNNDAIIVDNANQTLIAGPTGTAGAGRNKAGLQLLSTLGLLYFGNNSLEVNNTRAFFNFPTLVDTTGTGTITGSAALDVISTTKLFFPPRMTTTQRNAVSAPDEGGILYNSTTHKLTYRDASSWVELLTGGDGNGIYSGSGTIPNLTAATLTTGGNFKFKYFTGGDAMVISDNSQLQIFGPSGGSEITATATDAFISVGSNSLTVDGTKVAGQSPMILTVGGSGAIDTKAILDLDTVTKCLFPPRLTTTDRTNLGAVNDGAVIFNNTTKKLTVRANSTWVELADAAGGNGGIYGGSGTIAASCQATVTTSSFFKVRYANNNTAILVDDTAGTVSLAFKTTSGTPSAGVQVNSGQIFMYTGSSVQNTLTIDKATAKTTFANGDVYVNSTTGSGTSAAASGLELDSTNKVLYPPRMTTTQRDAISTAGVADGAVLYNSTTNKFTVRQNGAWVEMSNATGTVTASGPPANHQVATWTSATNVTGSNNFWWDDTNNRLGIGVGGNVPLKTLHVFGAARFDGTGIHRGTGLNNADGAPSIQLINTTASTGDTYYLHSKDDGTFAINSSAAATDIITIAPSTRRTTVTQSFGLSGVTTTSSLSTDQNDFNIGDNGRSAVLRWVASTPINVSGITGGVAGRIIYMFNTTSNNITLLHASIASTAGNRFLCPGNANFSIRENGFATIWYDGTTSRWRILSYN